jgi:iron complex outermembrane receptor protein
MISEHTLMQRSFVLVLAFAGAASATAQTPAPPPASPPPRDTAVTITGVTVTAAAEKRTVTRAVMPVTRTVTAEHARETVNLVDPEDVLKYQPSLFLRKRNNGDTQATVGTRVWGTSSSARSLIFADGVPISALIANNNTVGGPRWGLVNPEEIRRVDIMYGPFSAAYAGNSMGAVMEITTRLPERLEGSISQTQALQTFSLYGTKDTYSTAQTQGHIGNRFGKFSFWASGLYANSFSQPLSYVTAATIPGGITGVYPETNKLGAPANILGASGLLHTRMTNVKLKGAYDITPTVQAAYTFGLWSNDGKSTVDPYSRTTAGDATYAGQAAFATGYYNVGQQHMSHSLSVRSDTGRDWDFEVIGTRYMFAKDRQRFPTIASASGTTFDSRGRVAVLDDTGWGTFDAKGLWHKGGPSSATHSVSFGLHYDRYNLLNTTFNTSNWESGSEYTGIATEGDGKTRTEALWLQDAIRLPRNLKLTIGGRYEDFKAFDGLNVNGSTRVEQPAISDSKFSPKGILAWTPDKPYSLTFSVGRAYRFATATELYQLVSTGTTFTSPNPDLRPDNALVMELRGERRFNVGSVGFAAFQDDVHDAIISQFLPLVPGSSTLYSYLANVDHVRGRGIEGTLNVWQLPVTGLSFTGNVTYLNAKTLELAGRASPTAPAGSAVGKQLPNIPKWRFAFATTYRPDDRMSVSLSGRYSDKVYTTLDNADVHFNTYQGFNSWFVADVHANYRLGNHWSGSLGVDNLLNRKYFLFHPFPQRTYVANVTYGF